MKRQPQTKTVLDHLKKGRPISTLYAFKTYNITRLGRVIFDLRRSHGHDIFGKRVEHNGVHYTMYYTEECKTLFDMHGKIYES